MQWLGLRDDGSVDREVRLARAETTRAGLAALAEGGGGEMIGFLRRKYEARLQGAETPEGAPDPAGSDGWRDFHGAQRRAQAEERRILSDLRTRGVIGDDAFHQLEEELDWAEVHTQARGGGDREPEP
jgi:CPA1 family monovalent cation:H+ antiporter